MLRVALAVAVMGIGCGLPEVRSLEGPPRAALAFRDRVPAYQRAGTSLFTRAILDDPYSKLAYVTQGEDRNPEAFRAELEALLRRYRQVDLFLLAHSNRFIDVVRDIEPALRRRLRLVYNTGCSNANQGNEWLALGAEAYVGHAGSESVSPIFYYYFAQYWAAGVTLYEAVGMANYRAREYVDFMGLDPAFDAVATIYGDSELWVGSARGDTTSVSQLSVPGSHAGSHKPR